MSKPEDIFKIEDSSEIPVDNYQKEEPSKEEESSDKNPINEKKEFNLTDLMDLLKKNKIDADTSVVEKTYNNIVLEKKEKESITNIIKELQKEETTIKENVKSNDGGGENVKLLDSKIKELSDKIANLNVSEREKEDNIKMHVNSIFKNEKYENMSSDKSSNNNQLNVKNEILHLINNEINGDKGSNPVESLKNPDSTLNAVQTSKNPDSTLNAVESLKNPESSLNTIQTSKNPESSLNTVQTSKNPDSTLNAVQTSKNPDSTLNAVQTSKNPDSTLNAVESLKNPESSLNTIQTSKNPDSTLNAVESLKNPESSIFGKDSEIPPKDASQSNASMGKIDSDKNTTTSSNIENLKTSESIAKNENVVEELKKVESEIPNFEGNADSADNSSDFKKINESIGKMSDLMIKGFSNLGENMGSLKSKNSELSNTANAPASNGSERNPNSVAGDPSVVQKNYIDEYRKSIRNDLPLKSLMGISTKLKGNNIGSFI